MSAANINRKIKSRKDLSFTNFESGGNSPNWSVPHDKDGCWSSGIVMGKYLFGEIAALASHDELESFEAIHRAMNNPGWDSHGWGIEEGFSKELAAAAIIGLRVLRDGGQGFDYERLLQEWRERCASELDGKQKKSKAKTMEASKGARP